MPLQVDAQDWPILVLRPSGEISLEEWKAGWAQVESQIASRPGPFGLLADARQASAPSALMRNVVRDFFDSQRAVLEARCGGLAIVVRSRAVRAAATAVFWFIRPAIEINFEPELDRGLAWLQKRLEAAPSSRFRPTQTSG